jgi:ABC-2 type transport system ATP-binding protein
MIQVRGLTRRFGDTTVVDDVSFDVQPGLLTGFVGGNGAGKTTTMRMMMGLLGLHGGEVLWGDRPITDADLRRIGYMPEERGLYPHMRVLDCLVYLGTLKGLSRAEARRRAEHYLERLELADQQRVKIGSLSRGMTQKVQVIAAVLHAPDLLIIDEPFANLDPVNAQLVRDIILELRDQGKAVIMTSHQLALVEALCDRIALIHHGRVVLEGSVSQVRRQFATNILRLKGTGTLPDLPGVLHVERRTASDWQLTLEPQADPHQILNTIVTTGQFTIDSFEVALPTLDEIFVQTVRTVGVNGQRG